MANLVANYYFETVTSYCKDSLKNNHKRSIPPFSSFNYIAIILAHTICWNVHHEIHQMSQGSLGLIYDYICFLIHIDCHPITKISRSILYCWQFDQTFLDINYKWKRCIEGIVQKGPYPPCLRMADRALLAGYPRYMAICLGPFQSTPSPLQETGIEPWCWAS